MPKTVETRRHCEECATIFCNHQKPGCREGVAEDRRLLHALYPPRSGFFFNSFWHLHPTSFLMTFTLAASLFVTKDQAR